LKYRYLSFQNSKIHHLVVSYRYPRFSSDESDPARRNPRPLKGNEKRYLSFWICAKHNHFD
jgi:hypothetical protein